MNKKHWNTVYFENALEDTFLIELIDHSYDLVVKSLRRNTYVKLVHDVVCVSFPMETASFLTRISVGVVCITLGLSSAGHGPFGTQILKMKNPGKRLAKNVPEVGRGKFIRWRKSKASVSK